MKHRKKEFFINLTALTVMRRGLFKGTERSRTWERKKTFRGRHHSILREAAMTFFFVLKTLVTPQTIINRAMLREVILPYASCCVGPVSRASLFSPTNFWNFLVHHISAG